MTPLDVLIPTCCRPAALAVTLSSLVFQQHSRFRVIISDQTPDADVFDAGEVKAIIRLLRFHGIEVKTHKHLPRRGMAEQRQFLLDQVQAPYTLFLDDDLMLEPYVLDVLSRVLEREKCGFAGCALIGLSYLADIRPAEQFIEFWDGPVSPEIVRPGSPAWERWRLHNAANILHVQQQLGVSPDAPLTYRVAWVGGCVLYDTSKLLEAGGFDFWRELPPEHSGEDVLVQMRVMARFGGCGVLPSGVYHQELKTTIQDRRVDAPHDLRLV